MHPNNKMLADAIRFIPQPLQVGRLLPYGPVALVVSFLSRREDFSSCQQYPRVLRGQKSFNTEDTEMLRVLCVKA